MDSRPLAKARPPRDGLFEFRVRTHIGDAEMDSKVGRILTPGDYNVEVTGPARVFGPEGQVLAVYLPGVLATLMDEAWPVLSPIRKATDNRGDASGTLRVQRGDQKRTRTRLIYSTIAGAVDPGPSSTAKGRSPACRLTAWTGKHLPAWQSLTPLFQAIDGHFRARVPDRYLRQQSAAQRTHPEWLIPGTTFTTVTVNNSYSTGVHRDAGDLREGFSTLAVARRGAYTGGHLVLPRYRMAFDLQHGDLLLFDAHEYHGNTAMTCPHQEKALDRPCAEGCERVSLVSYFRTKVQQCGTTEEELAKAMERIEVGQ